MTRMGRPPKPREERFVERVHVSILPATKARMETITRKTGRSLSDIGREALRLYLEKVAEA